MQELLSGIQGLAAPRVPVGYKFRLGSVFGLAASDVHRKSCRAI